MEVIGLFIVVAGAVVLATVALIIYVIVKLVRGAVRLTFSSGNKPALPVAGRAANLVRCVQMGCHTDNPPHARYCRKCGVVLREPAQWDQRRRIA
jgi:ribosomal protein L40E